MFKTLNWHDGIYARRFMEADPVEAFHVRALGLSMRLVLIESYGLVHLVWGLGVRISDGLDRCSICFNGAGNGWNVDV